jgi:hypothetical protein
MESLVTGIVTLKCSTKTENGHARTPTKGSRERSCAFATDLNSDVAGYSLSAEALDD